MTLNEIIIELEFELISTRDWMKSQTSVHTNTAQVDTI